MYHFNTDVAQDIQAFEDLFNEISKTHKCLPSTQKYKGIATDSSLNPKELEMELTDVSSTLTETQKEKESYEKENAGFKKRSKEMETKYKIMMKEKTQLENELQKMLNAKISSRDELVTRLKRIRYKALTRITQVKFNFDKCNGQYLKGFFFRYNERKIRLFSVDIRNLSDEEVADKLYDLMEPTREASEAK